MLKWLGIPAIGLLAMLPTASNAQVACGISAATVTSLQNQLAVVIKMDNGGIFQPNRMWSAIVDRQGKLCSAITAGVDPWLTGSRADRHRQGHHGQWFQQQWPRSFNGQPLWADTARRFALWPEQLEPV